MKIIETLLHVPWGVHMTDEGQKFAGCEGGGGYIEKLRGILRVMVEGNFISINKDYICVCIDQNTTISCCFAEEKSSLVSGAQT